MRYRKIFVVIIVVIITVSMNGCWINEVTRANKINDKRMDAVVEYLEKKYGKKVENIHVTDYGYSFKKIHRHFDVNFEDEGVEFPVKFVDNIEDSYLVYKWRYQMDLIFGERIPQKVEQEYFEEDKVNTRVITEISFDWNLYNMDFNSNYDIPTEIKQLSVEELYKHGLILNTSINQYNWILESSLEEEEEKLKNYVSVLSNKYRDVEFTINNKFYLSQDDFNKVKDLLKNIEGLRYINQVNRSVQCVANAIYRSSYNEDGAFSSYERTEYDPLYSDDGLGIDLYLKKLCDSKEMHEFLRGERLALDESKFDSEEILNVVNKQLNIKYQNKIEFIAETQLISGNIEYLPEDMKLAYIRLVANDIYNTNFLVLVDCSDYRKSPVVCRDNYMENFIKNYLAEDYFNLDDLNISNYSVEEGTRFTDKNYSEILERFLNGNYDEIIHISSNYTINLILSDSDSISDDELTLIQDQLELLLYGAKKKFDPSERGELKIFTYFYSKESMEVSEDKIFVRDGLLFFNNERDLLGLNWLYDSEKLYYSRCLQKLSIKDGVYYSTKLESLSEYYNDYLINMLEDIDKDVLIQTE